MNRINQIIAIGIVLLLVLLLGLSLFSFWSWGGMMGPGMMGGWGMTGSWGWGWPGFFLMMVFPLGFLVLLILGVVWLIRLAGGIQAGPPAPPPASPPGKTCPSCGRTVQEDWQLCPYCGESLV
ncbi:MAG TPA: zinc ribbon domain-containing protein [Chloroflexi bacterium]|nr:zinc ribbon domain-containing protein [Chloroflexota bacterium]